VGLVKGEGSLVEGWGMTNGDRTWEDVGGPRCDTIIVCKLEGIVLPGVGMWLAGSGCGESVDNEDGSRITESSTVVILQVLSEMGISLVGNFISSNTTFLEM
jgi:hypothetical protein